MTKYLVVLTYILIAAVTIVSLFGHRIKEGVYRAEAALSRNQPGKSPGEIAGGVPAGTVGQNSGGDFLSGMIDSADSSTTSERGSDSTRPTEAEPNDSGSRV
jgi:hypothetical protein